MFKSAEGVIDLFDILSNIANIASNMKGRGGIAKSFQDPVFVEKMKKDSDELAKKLLKKGDEPRGEMIAFIVSLPDEYAKANLLRRHADRMECKHKTYPHAHGENQGLNEKYRVGDEDEFINILTKQYVALNGSEKGTLDEAVLERDMRENMFCILGNMDDKTFDATLEMLHHRPEIVNLIRKAIHHWPKMKEDLIRLDKYGAEKIFQFRQELESKEVLYSGLGERKVGRFRRFVRWIGT